MSALWDAERAQRRADRRFALAAWLNVILSAMTVTQRGPWWLSLVGLAAVAVAFGLTIHADLRVRRLTTTPGGPDGR